MAHLGHMYANGEGVAQDNATAASWFTKAAEHGGWGTGGLGCGCCGSNAGGGMLCRAML